MPQLKEYYHDVDLKANQLFNSRLHNITTAARIFLGGSLGIGDKGYQVYDVDLLNPYFWDGTAWQSAGGTIPNLQQVTDVIPDGNKTTNSIIIDGGDLNMDGGNVVLRGDLGSSVAWTDNINATTLQAYLPTSNATITLPNITGTLALSVNGVGAIADGSITIPVGTGTVTDVTATLPLSSSSGTTPDISISQADAITDGYLSFTDWNTFNDKEPAITAGTTSDYWRGDKTWQTFPTIPTVGTWGALNYPTWVSGTPFVKMDAAGSFTLDSNTYLTSAVTSIATSSPITGGTITGTGTIGITQASTSTDGYLSSTDWNTFNNKWGLSGNAGTTAGTNFIGTTDNIDVVIKRNNTVVNTFRANGNHSLAGDVTINPSISTGSNNLTVGLATLANITTGSRNIQIANSASTLTTGSENIFIGSLSGYDTSTGIGNVAIGAASLVDTFLIKNYTGNFNVAIGRNAGLSYNGLTSGAENTFLGYFSGASFAAAASKNIAIGSNVEIQDPVFPNSTPTTGSNNIIIGNNIQLPVRTASNQLNIGNFIYGTGLSGTYRTLSPGKIGIGVAAPSEALDISGNLKFSGALMPNNLAGTAGQVLTSAGTGTAPTWTTPSTSGGTVTSIATAGLISGGNPTPITNTGTISTSMTTGKLVGRYSSGTGVMEEVSVGSGLTLTGAGILNNTATPTPLGYYGAWQDILTQTAAASNVGYPLIFRTIDLENQVRVVTDGTNLTRITFDNTGIYNLQFSVQIQNTDNAQHDVTIWLRKQGTDVVGSAGFISVPARKSAGAGNEGHGVYGWNYLLSVVAGEYYEIVWSTSNSTHITIQYYAAGSPPPSTASVLATVTQQAGIMAGTGITRGIYSVSSNTTAGSGANVDYVYLVSGTTTITLPTAASNTNTYTIKNIGSNTVTINTTTLQTIDGSTSASLPVQYSSLTMVSDGSNWNII